MFIAFLMVIPGIRELQRLVGFAEELPLVV